MATTAPTPTWSYGNVVNYTDEAVTDDTAQWSYGNVLSHLEYGAAGAVVSLAPIQDPVHAQIVAPPGLQGSDPYRFKVLFTPKP
jgi:hypothetical protein